jgi:hypothetical protein
MMCVTILIQTGPRVLIKKSTIDFYTFVDGNLVTWRSKKQNVMARSSAETEYQAMTLTTSELTWIKQIVADMSIIIPKPMKIFCDNQAARHIALNLMFHERTKYIDVDCHFVREKNTSRGNQNSI